MYLSTNRNRKRILIFIGVAAVVLASIFIYSLKKNDESEDTMLQPILAVSPQSDIQLKPESHPPTVPKDVIVDVKGEVVSPNVYVLKEGSRVNDAVIAAGGMTADADRDIVNLAMQLTDGMAVIIPKIGEEPRATIDTSGGTAAVSGQTENGKININSADASHLDSLPGIGPAKAEAIVQYRVDNGPFGSIEDLKNVSGIGDKTFEQLKDFITVH